MNNDNNKNTEWGLYVAFSSILAANMPLYSWTQPIWVVATLIVKKVSNCDKYEDKLALYLCNFLTYTLVIYSWWIIYSFMLYVVKYGKDDVYEKVKIELTSTLKHSVIEFQKTLNHMEHDFSNMPILEKIEGIKNILMLISSAFEKVKDLTEFLLYSAKVRAFVGDKVYTFDQVYSGLLSIDAPKEEKGFIASIKSAIGIKDRKYEEIIEKLEYIMKEVKMMSIPLSTTTDLKLSLAPPSIIETQLNLVSSTEIKNELPSSETKTDLVNENSLDFAIATQYTELPLLGNFLPDPAEFVKMFSESLNLKNIELQIKNFISKHIEELKNSDDIFKRRFVELCYEEFQILNKSKKNIVDEVKHIGYTKTKDFLWAVNFDFPNVVTFKQVKMDTKLGEKNVDLGLSAIPIIAMLIMFLFLFLKLKR